MVQEAHIEWTCSCWMKSLQVNTWKNRVNLSKLFVFGCTCLFAQWRLLWFVLWSREYGSQDRKTLTRQRTGCPLRMPLSTRRALYMRCENLDSALREELCCAKRLSSGGGGGLSQSSPLCELTVWLLAVAISGTHLVLYESHLYYFLSSSLSNPMRLLSSSLTLRLFVLLSYSFTFVSRYLGSYCNRLLGR